MTSKGDCDTSFPLCGMFRIFKSRCFFLSFPWRIAQKTCRRYGNLPNSSRNTQLKEKKKKNWGHCDTNIPLCDIWRDTEVHIFSFSFFKINWEGARVRRHVWHTTFLSAQSGRHERISERPPEAALVWFTLICTDEPFWLWPGNHQAPLTLSPQPLMKKVQISCRSTHMLPLHIRQLSVQTQEANAQMCILEATAHFNICCHDRSGISEFERDSVSVDVPYLMLKCFKVVEIALEHLRTFKRRGWFCKKMWKSEWK